MNDKQENSLLGRFLRRMSHVLDNHYHYRSTRFGYCDLSLVDTNKESQDSRFEVADDFKSRQFPASLSFKSKYIPWNENSAHSITKTSIYSAKSVTRSSDHRALFQPGHERDGHRIDTSYVPGNGQPEKTQWLNQHGEKKRKKSALGLQDQEVWRRERGYWIGELTFINDQGKYDYNASNNPTSGQYNYQKYYGFINLQVDDLRLEQRNIFLRPNLVLDQYDFNKDGITSSAELDLANFSSLYDYKLAGDYATPLVIGESQQASDRNGLIDTFDYTKGTEATFTASQAINPTTGLLQGDFFGIPTTTRTIGDDTIVYRAGDDSRLFQNQLTTATSRESRVRTAQGFNPFLGGEPTYGSYYREVKVKAEVDKKGYVTRTAREIFLEKLHEYREIANIDESQFTSEEHFTTGLEVADPRGVEIGVDSVDTANLITEAWRMLLKGTSEDDVILISKGNSKVVGDGGADTFVIQDIP